MSCRKKLKQLLIKYKSVILYLFFGGCTTLVNVAVYYICAHIVSIATIPSTIAAWIAAVLFAYLTNRKWVFDSEETSITGVIKEMLRFFGCRLGTGVLDWACMYIFVDLLLWNDVIMKIIVNIAVIILNYIASKLVIFHKDKKL